MTDFQDCILSCDFEGKNFKENLKDQKPHLIHPFAVAIHKDLMYWDDWNQKSIFFADKHNGSGIDTLLANMPGSMDLKVRKKKRYEERDFYSMNLS